MDDHTPNTNIQPADRKGDCRFFPAQRHDYLLLTIEKTTTMLPFQHYQQAQSAPHRTHGSRLDKSNLPLIVAPPMAIAVAVDNLILLGQPGMETLQLSVSLKTRPPRSLYVPFFTSPSQAPKSRSQTDNDRTEPGEKTHIAYQKIKSNPIVNKQHPRLSMFQSKNCFRSFFFEFNFLWRRRAYML